MTLPVPILDGSFTFSVPMPVPQITADMEDEDKARVTETQALYAQAVSNMDKARPGHWLGKAELVITCISNVEDAKTLAAAWAEHQIPTGFDIESCTKTWGPRVLRKNMYGVMKDTPIHQHHSEHRPKSQIFQISWGAVCYIVPARYIPIFKDVIEATALLDVANIGMEFNVMNDCDVRMQHFHRDVLQQYWLLDHLHRMPSLKKVSKALLGLDLAKYNTEFSPIYDLFLDNPGWVHSRPMTDAEVKAIVYAAFDPFITTMVADLIDQMLEAQPAGDQPYTTKDYYQRIERSNQMASTRMFRNGIPIDLAVAAAHFESLTKEVDKIDGQALKIVGRALNFGSGKELSGYYYGELGYPPSLTNKSFSCLAPHGKYGKSKLVTSRTNYACNEHGKGFLVNVPKVDGDALESFKKNGDPLAGLIMRSRNRSKIRDGAVLSYPHIRDPKTGMGYPDIASTGTISGRFSGSGSWLTTTKEVRDILQEEEDSLYYLMAVDYAQLELRILAHITKDPVMLDAINKGRDLHCATASILAPMLKGEDFRDAVVREKWYPLIAEAKQRDDAGLPLTELQEWYLTVRSMAKTTIFAIIYGAGAGKLALQYNIPRMVADNIFSAVLKGYPKMGETFDRRTAETKKTGEIFTILGRRLNLNKQYAAGSSKGDQAYGGRLVRNWPNQAGGADIMRLVKIQIDLDFEAGGRYGKEGRLAYGTWIDGQYHIDWSCLPVEWEDNLPPALANNLGRLGELDGNAILEVHDELNFRVLKTHAEEFLARVQAIMEDPFGDMFDFIAPLATSGKYGRSYKEIK